MARHLREHVKIFTSLSYSSREIMGGKSEAACISSSTLMPVLATQHKIMGQHDLIQNCGIIITH